MINKKKVAYYNAYIKLGKAGPNSEIFKKYNPLVVQLKMELDAMVMA